MKRLKLYMMASMLLLIAGSCAVMDIDRKADFTSYRTFEWGKPETKVENPVYESELITKNIKATIEKEFAKRGIMEDPANADFIVSYKTFTEQKQEYRGGGFYGRPWGFYPWSLYGYPMLWGGAFGWAGPTQQRTFTQGTLIIDIKDKRTDELVWRGTVSGNVDDVADLQKQIQKGIKAIMKKYPVTPQEPLKLPAEENVIS